MAEKQTILGRITQLAKANINALLDKAEDPQKMICLLYTSPSPRDRSLSRMPSSA